MTGWSRFWILIWDGGEGGHLVERRDSIAWSRRISLVRVITRIFLDLYYVPFHVLPLPSIQPLSTVHQLGVRSSRRPDTKQLHTVIPQSNPYSLLTN